MGRATLADVARVAGVSPSTVSLTFSGSGPVSAGTRERVLAAARELGYAGPDPLARSLRRGASGVVGVLTGGQLAGHFRDPVAIRTLDGIADALGAHDLGMLLIRVNQRGEGAELAARTAMDAAIFLRSVDDTDEVVPALLSRGVHVVLMESSSTLPDVATLRIDDRPGMAELARKVLALGHERIAFVTLPWAPGSRPGLRDGAAADPALAVHGWTRGRMLGALEAGVRPTAVYETRGSLVEEGFEAATALLTAPERPTAIMAFSDLLAAGVVLAARELGLSIPGDVSVTGFDGVDLPWLTPQTIESVEQPFARKGQLAGEAAVQMMRGGEPMCVELQVWPRPGTTLGPAPRRTTELPIS